MGAENGISKTVQLQHIGWVDVMCRQQPAPELFFQAGTVDGTRSEQEKYDMEKRYQFGFILQYLVDSRRNLQRSRIGSPRLFETTARVAAAVANY